ncbi:winged helix DNA-binding domain-containing protein [Myxococcus sp. CA039A]|nr:winged helix DNA-binding domain-containing protein [Myxococcus sp. CA039A]
MIPIPLMFLPFPFIPAEETRSRVGGAKNPGRRQRVVAAPRNVKEVALSPRSKSPSSATTPRRSGKGGLAPVLTTRELNRALLQRQYLLRRTASSLPEVIEHLVGLQAQAGNAPYLALWTRMKDFQLDDLTRCYQERTVVRATMMRSTQHLVTARDFQRLRPTLQAVLDRMMKQSVYPRELVGLDLDLVVAEGRKLLAKEPLSTVELGRRLQARWPERDARALSFVVRVAEPLVTVPPFGTWGVGGEVEFATSKSWFGEPPGPALPLEDVVLRYLGAFGPASVKDMQAWSGLIRLADTVEQLRPRLRTFRDEQGVELFDVPDAPRPEGDTPAPVRLVAEFDNLLLSHAERSRIISEPYRKRVFTINGIIRPTVLVDGFVRGMWKLEREKERVTLRIEPFERIAREDRAALTEEGARLLAFAAPDSPSHDVHFAPVS